MKILEVTLFDCSTLNSLVGDLNMNQHIDCVYAINCCNLLHSTSDIRHPTALADTDFLFLGCILILRKFSVYFFDFL